MINVNRIIDLIDITLKEADNVASSSKYLHPDKEPIYSTKKVLNLLRGELKNNPQQINERILRAMHDVGMSAYKDFENTSLEEAINSLVEILSKEVPGYRTLGPLRSEFGKEYPI